MTFHLVVTHIIRLLGFVFFQSSLGWWMSYYQTPSLIYSVLTHIYSVLTQKCRPNWYVGCLSHRECMCVCVCVRERGGGGGEEIGQLELMHKVTLLAGK